MPKMFRHQIKTEISIERATKIIESIYMEYFFDNVPKKISIMVDYLYVTCNIKTHNDKNIFFQFDLSVLDSINQLTTVVHKNMIYWRRQLNNDKTIETE